MKYYFDIQDGHGTLTTKGTSHTDFSGYNVIKHSCDSKTVIDAFRVMDKFNSTEDVDYCYDYYNVDCFVRNTDEYFDECFGTVEDAMCEEDEYIDERISAVEDAICELDEMWNGGE